MADKLHRNALRPGYQLLWYSVERVLGQGGFGITYLATDPNLDQSVAIKEYLPIELAVREGDFSVHPVSEERGETFKWGLDRFITEARTLARFDHPNIVRVLSVFEENNTAYMVMRYEEGGSLQDMLPRAGTLEEGPLMNILLPVLGGLKVVHDQGFIHRDIKPANLYIRNDGSPVLLDFGSARQAVGSETRTLTTLVSPGYAPFEQYYSKSDRQGPWTDIYGLGATLYRAAVGRAPADALDRSEGLLKDTGDSYVPAVEAAAGRCSRRFLAAIDHALQFREEDRPQDVEQWLNELRVGDALTEVAPSVSSLSLDGDQEKSTPAAQTDVVDPDAATEQAPAAQAEFVQADATDREAAYRSFVGARNADYYLQRFREFDSRGGRLPRAWNTTAGLLTFFWMLHRKIYPWALVFYPLITLALTFMILVPISAFGFGGGDVPPRIAVPVLFLVSVLWPGFFGNAIYYRRARSLINRMSEHGNTPDEQLAWLAGKGGTSKRAMIIGAVVPIFLLLAIAGEQEKKRHRDTAAEPAATNDTKAEKVRQLLEAAHADFAALRLSTPPGNNALEKLRRILQIDPDNATARKGLRTIVEKYVELGREAAKGGDFDKARRYLNRALEIAPNSKELKNYKRRLENRSKTIRGLKH